MQYRKYIIAVVILWGTLISVTNALRQKRAAIALDTLKWPNGVIPYTIDRSRFNNKDYNMLLDAMRSWSAETCITFRPRNRENHWVYIRDGQKCFSDIGMHGYGARQLILSTNGCRFFGLYLHELGHTIGLQHEHVRPDRDGHVHIHMDAIHGGERHEYTKKDPSVIETYDTPYDLQSIMHYGSEKGNGGRGKISVRNNSLAHILDDVFVKDLSFWDVKAVNLRYRCSSRCAANIPCHSEGFIDRFCRCQTPEMFTERRCVNKLSDSHCRRLFNEGQCETQPVDMSVKCRKACGRCFRHDFAHREQLSCRNFHDTTECDAWARNGECERNTAYMHLQCKVSCGVCSGISTNAPQREPITSRTRPVTRGLQPGSVTSSPASSGSCVNTHDNTECDNWARSGECSRNVWMRPNCAKSCGFCPSASDSSITTAPPSCQNSYGDRQCVPWARRGECRTNAVWMRVNCAKACRVCGTSDQTSSRCSDQTGCPSVRRRCTTPDIFRRCPRVCQICGTCGDSRSDCNRLKDLGYCTRHALSTIPYCRRTCGVC